jgi:hypothetical protein
MTQMLAQREHDYFAETVICANFVFVRREMLSSGLGLLGMGLIYY